MSVRSIWRPRVQRRLCGLRGARNLIRTEESRLAATVHDTFQFCIWRLEADVLVVGCDQAHFQLYIGADTGVLDKRQRANFYVFASIANYLQQNGWQFQKPWAAIVNVKTARLHDLLGFENSRYLDFWKTLGVRSIANKPLPKSDGKLALLQLDGGPLILAYPNFKVIMRYNHSVYYAGTVGYLADKICRRSGVFG